MNEDILSIIKQTVTDTVGELKRQNLICDGNKQNPFRKVETLLYNYKNFAAAVKGKEERIKELREYGLRKKSNSVSSFSGAEGYIDVQSDMEKVEEQIESIEASIEVTQKYIGIIDDALSSLHDDPYFDIIRMKYFEGLSREDIAEHFSVDVKTVGRNKNRLINQLQIRMFSDQVLQQIFVS